MEKALKKMLLLLVMLVCFMVGTAFAGIKEMDEAYLNKDYVTAISEAGKVIADPNAFIYEKADAQRVIGHCYDDQENYTKAKAGFQKVIDTYPTEIGQCAYSLLHIGGGYYRQKQYTLAKAEFQKLISNYPTMRGNCADAQCSIGDCYDVLGDTEKAQEAFVKVLTDYPEITSQVSRAINKVNFASMTDEEALTILERIRRANPATEKNAEFLGRIKSEIEKLK